MEAWLMEIANGFTKAFITGDRWKLYLKGLGVTLELTVIALALGVILGVLVAVIRTAHDQQRPGHRNPLLGVLNALCKVYTTVIRGTPMMVQLLIWSSVIFASSRNHTLIGAFGIGINSGAYVAEIVRGGLMSVDGGQMEAGRSLGLGYLDTMRLIVVPQAFKNILPALGNEFVTLVKETSVAGYIGLRDLTKASDIVASRTYDYFVPLILAACVYLVIVLGLTKLVRMFERRLAQSDYR